MKTRWKILIALLAFVALSAVLSLLTLRVGPESRLEAYKDSLRAQGEKLEIAEIAPPSVPPEQNGRDAIQNAFNSFGPGEIDVPHGMWMLAPGKAMTGWNQPQTYGSNFTNSWEDFAANVAIETHAIESLRQAAERPKLDFGLDHLQGPTLPLPHLSPFKRSALVLSAACTLDLHQGDPASAATNLCVLLHLIQANEDEDIVVSHLVRIAMASFAVNGTWDLLQATNLRDIQLAELQKSWTDLQFIRSAEKALTMERAVTLMTIQRSRISGAYFESAYNGSYIGLVGGGTRPASFSEWLDGTKQAVGKTLWRASWSYSEELNFLRGDQIVLQTLRIMQTNQSWKTNYDSMQGQLSKIAFSYPGQTLIKKLDIPDFDGFFNNEYAPAVIRKTMAMEAARHVVITAIALKRYQIRHEHLPDAPTALTPDFLPAVPLDPIDANPLRYHRNDDGTYLLYSIGDDGVDNGGDPTGSGSGKPANLNRQNPHSRDWVWPQPATPTEIKLYWDEQAAAAK